MHSFRIRSFVALLLLFCMANFAFAEQPNILFILTDDQGWPSVSCNGNGRVQTPNVDRLASEGMRFTDAYVMPQCTPTRAALLTGQHTARNGMWHVIGRWYGYPWARVAEPSFVENLPRDSPTIAKDLKKAGYATGCFGKWHLTVNDDGGYVHLKQRAAHHYGFDVSAKPPSPRYHAEGDKGVDWLTDQTIEFIESNRDRPWFAYLSHHTIHGPVLAPQQLVEKHKRAGAPDSGYFNATYLASIEHFDQSVGRLTKALDRLNLTESTIVVFLADNGGVDTQYHLPKGNSPLEVKEQQYDNAPLRGGKGMPYEGGIRVPCVVRWPAVIKPNQIVKTPIHVTDWFPTLLDAAGNSDHSAAKLDGQSLVPLFRGEAIQQRDLFWYMPLYDLRWAATPCSIIRRGDWKLLEFHGDWFDESMKHQVGHRLELYNLSEDPGETTNLAQRNVDRAKAMQASLHKWIEEIGQTVPVENEHHDPEKWFIETTEKQPWNR